MHLFPTTQLTTKGDPTSEFHDMRNDNAALSSLRISHGTVVHLLYHGERQVPGVKLSEFDRRPFGAHMTVESMVAAQTRLERQETPNCASVSFDMHAANAFQSYVQSALAFSIKRGGILYGTVEEEGGVAVNAIYEPPQQGSANRLVLERGTEEEQRADVVAAAFGWTKVGWIFTQSTKEREFICSGEEICQMAAIQAEMGEKAVTAMVALFPSEEESEAPEVHFEAFQVSSQCVKLWQEGWFKLPSTDNDDNDDDKAAAAAAVLSSGTIALQNPKDLLDKTPVIVARKDVGEIDADYFLVPVGIKDHEGPVMTTFPIENRLLAQGTAELKSHLRRYSGASYAERLSDFHALLFVAKQPGLEVADVAVVAAAVAEKGVVPEGYKMIIDSIAGL